MNTPNYGYGWQTGADPIDRTLFDEGLRQHMLRVYNYMGVAWWSPAWSPHDSLTPAPYVPIFSTPLKWVVMLAPLGLSSFSFRMQTISAASAQALFWAFSRSWACRSPRVPGFYRNQHRAHLLHRRHDVRRYQPLRLHDQARSSQFASFLIMGLIGVVIASFAILSSHRARFSSSLDDRHPCLHRPDRLGMQSIKEQYA